MFGNKKQELMMRELIGVTKANNRLLQRIAKADIKAVTEFEVAETNGVVKKKEPTTILDFPLMKDSSRTLKDGILDQLAKSGASVEVLSTGFPSFEVAQLTQALDMLVDKKLVEVYTKRTTVDGVSAHRILYRTV